MSTGSGHLDPEPAPTDRPRLDVVIPARGEAETLPGCLLALLGEARGLDVKVIVVANGPERGPTLAAAQALNRAFAHAGVPLVVVEEPSPGKPLALNRGDQEYRGSAVMYLDADTVLLAGTLGPIARELTGRDAPLLIAPRPQLVLPADRLARHWALVWRTLPAVAGDVIGGGCFAVNQAGRARWDRFPDLLGDDSFVRSRFNRTERKLAEGGGFIQVLPEGRALIASIRRWRAANDDLRSMAPGAPDAALAGNGSHPGAGLGRNLVHVLLRPRLWPYFPGFLFATWRAKASAWTANSAGAWTPQRGPKTGAAAVDRALSIEAAAGNFASDSRWAEISPTQPDEPAQVSHVLLADAPLPEGLLDDLLAYALRFPEAGAWVVSERIFDDRAPFAVRPLTGETAPNTGPVLIATPALRDMDQPPLRSRLPKLWARGWRPVIVQLPQQRKNPQL